jgi:asparagine synthase (glutamine-hydrolysing)
MPVSWKVRETEDGRLVEKWLLREAFKDQLPDGIYRREKLRFSRGTGVEALAEKVVGKLAGEEGLAGGWETPAGYRINSPVEAYYYKLYKESFPDPAFERLVGRWDPEK